MWDILALSFFKFTQKRSLEEFLLLETDVNYVDFFIEEIFFKSSSLVDKSPLTLENALNFAKNSTAKKQSKIETYCACKSFEETNLGFLK